MEENKKATRQPVQKKKGFSVLSFILGLLLGIIILAGAITGVGFYAVNSDLDGIFSMFGVDNGKDENGNNKLVNTDPENGGAKNILDLLKKVMNLASDTDNLTLGQIQNLLPATRGITDQLHDAVAQYVEIDMDELCAVKFSALSDYIKDLVMDVQPANLVNFENTDGINGVINLILCGAECEYENVGGRDYFLYADEYADDGSGNYTRVPGGAALPAELKSYITEDEYTGKKYVYYYGISSDGTFDYFVTSREEGGAFKDTSADAGCSYNSLFDADCAGYSGNYYYEDGVKTVVNPVTIGTITSSENAFEPLNRVLIVDLIDNPDDMIVEILGDVTLGALLNDNVNIEERVKNLEISSILDIDPESVIMSYFGYGLTDVKQRPGEALTYTAQCTVDDVKREVTVECAQRGSEKYITRVYYFDGGDEIEVSGTKVGDVSARIDGVTKEIKIGSLMNIGEDEPNSVLKAIANSTVSSLSEDLAAISINELYADTIYGDGENVELKEAVQSGASSGQIDFDESYLYYVETDGAYKLVKTDNDDGSDNGKLTGAEFASGTAEGITYYTYGAPNELWKLLVIERTGDGGENITERAYSLNNITDMIDNITSNMEYSTLRNLSNAGVLNFEDPSDLEKQVPIQIDDGPSQTALGDLTIPQAITALLDIIDKYNSLFPGA